MMGHLPFANDAENLARDRSAMRAVCESSVHVYWVIVNANTLEGNRFKEKDFRRCSSNYRKLKVVVHAPRIIS